MNAKSSDFEARGPRCGARGVYSLRTFMGRRTRGLASAAGRGLPALPTQQLRSAAGKLRHADCKALKFMNKTESAQVKWPASCQIGGALPRRRYGARDGSNHQTTAERERIQRQGKNMETGATPVLRGAMLRAPGAMSKAQGPRSAVEIGGDPGRSDRKILAAGSG
jgi:hypothetical protein